MNEEDLVKSAAKAAGEPIGEVGDISSSAELEHAFAVLQSATVEPNPERITELTTTTTDNARSGKLWHFFAVAVVFFCIGMIALIKIGFTPPEKMTPIAEGNTPTNQAPTNAPSNAAPEEEPEEQVYVRPAWITEQVVEIAMRPLQGKSGTPVELGGGSGDDTGGSSGGAPGAGPAGGGEEEAGGGYGSQGGSGVLVPGTLPRGLKLITSATVPAEESGVGFDLVRSEYTGNTKSLLILQGNANSKSRAALNHEGLKGNAYSVEVGQSMLLLVSNFLSVAELKKLASEIVEKR